LPARARPSDTVIVTGKVIDEAGYYMNANLLYSTSSNSGSNGKRPAKVGTYTLVLNAGYVYSIEAKGSEFLSSRKLLDLRNKKIQKRILNFKVLHYKRLKFYKLNSISFKTGSSLLGDKKYPELNKILKILKSNIKLKVEISGYADSSGGKKVNSILSLERAKRVKEYLVKQGARKEQIIPRGYGTHRPSSTNKSMKGRKKNRRVAFRVL